MEEADFERINKIYKERPQLSIISDQLKLNIGLIFTNKDLNEIKDILDAGGREAPARVGSIAPDSVVIPPGPTGLDPKQTGFFQALSIQTKIVKAQIEIVNPVTIIKEGEKINASQSALLDKLKIRPFQYKMVIKNFLEGDKLVDAKVLSIKNDDIIAKFQKGASNLTALSLGSGYIIDTAAPHLVMNAFKNLASASLAINYEFDQLKALKSAAAATPAPAKAAAAAEEKKPDKKEEKVEEEEEDMDMGGFFGEDDGY